MIIGFEIGFQFRRMVMKSEIRAIIEFSQELKAVKSSNRATAHVLASGREDQQVEVVLEEGSGSVALRLSTWAEGLGWCTQKTIRLDAEQLDDLHHAISVARHRLNRRRVDDGQFRPAAQVIQLPTVA
jgi:hypothetical protein